MASCFPPLPLRVFWDKVEVSQGCWNWIASLDADGYGQLTFCGKHKKATRFAWEIGSNLSIAGVSVLHTCDNPACVRPDHLFLGTQRDNLRDMSSKGRSTRGEKQWMSKLTEAKVCDILTRYAPGNGAQLAREYGVVPETVYKIVARKNWAHLKGEMLPA